MSSLRLPRFFIGLLLFVIPLFTFPFLPRAFDFPKTLLFHTVLLAIGMSLAAIFFLQGKLRWPKERFFSPISICLCVLSAIFLFSTLVSQSPIQAFWGTYYQGQGFLEWIFFIVFFIVLLFTLTAKNLSIFLTIIFSSTVITALYGLFQKFGFDPLFKDFDTLFLVGRIFSTLGNPDFLGQYIGPVLPLGIALFFLLKNKIIKSLIAIGVIVCISALVFTESRAPFLGMLLSALIFVVFLFLRTKINKKILVAAVFCLGLTVAALLTIPQLKTLPLVQRFTISENNLRSIESRFILWKSAAGVIRDHPFFGTGLDTFNLYFPQYADPKFFTLEENLNTFADRVHNEFLELGVSGGILAMLGYLALISIVFWLYLKGNFASPAFAFLHHGIFLGFFVLIFQNIVAFSEISHWLLFFFFLAGMVTLAKPASKQIFHFNLPKAIGIGLMLLVSLFSIWIWKQTVFLPFKAEMAYAESLETEDLDQAMQSLTKATEVYPFLAHYWYDLLMTDPSSSAQAMDMLTEIEGDTFQISIWKATLLSYEYPEEAFENFKNIIKKNPRSPHIHLAFADALYGNEEFKKAVIEYEQYIALIPSFWKWTIDLDSITDEELDRYRIFFSENEDVWDALERLIESYQAIGEFEQANFYKPYLP